MLFLLSFLYSNQKHKLKKKPIYAFIISDEVNVNIKYIDQGFKAEKLLAFKTKIKKSQCSFWHNKEELAYEVSQTLINAVNNLKNIINKKGRL